MLNPPLSEPLNDYGPAIGGGFLGGVVFGGVCVLLYGLYSAWVEGRPLVSHGLDPANLPIFSGTCCPGRGGGVGKPFQYTVAVSDKVNQEGESTSYSAPSVN